MQPSPYMELLHTDPTSVETVLHYRRAEYLHGDGGWSTGQQIADTHVLLIVTDGEGTLTLADQECRLHRDTVYLGSPGESYGVTAEPSHGLKLVLLRFDVYRQEERGELRQGKLDPELPDVYGLHRVLAGDQLSALCSSILECREMKDPMERLRCQSLFHQLIYAILRGRSLRQPEDSRSGVERARGYMDRFYFSDITIDRLAQLSNTSRKYFVDLFKKTYGVSAMDYLTALRMKHAKLLMSRSPDPKRRLKEIAQAVGYADEFYFSRKFKQVVGVSPKEYRSRRSRRIAAYHVSAIGHLVALDIIPYAAPLHPKWTAHYYKTYKDEIPVHLHAGRRRRYEGTGNAERLLESDPDIILCSEEPEEEEREVLEQAGGLLCVPPGDAGWKDQLLTIAEALDGKRDAEIWLAGYERKVRTARNRLKHTVGKDTFLILRIYNRDIRVYSNRSLSEVFFGDLQLHSALEAQEEMYDRVITPKELAEIPADRLLLLVRQEEETLNFWRSLQTSAVWQNLKAVRNQRVYTISPDPWCEYSASAHERLLEQTIELLTGNRP
ncbi:AraC family transcriptional regulator [Gorillibacterium sp. sgz5001074]|uniref:AraC family transcriptional regulator n=1 Tax=Gorillibacterium sp. sgz5001074 TaxID=3446695 RepID=UPI003F66C474